LLSHLEIPKRRVPVLLSRGTGMMRSSITRLKMIEGMPEVIGELRRHCGRIGILTSNATANVELFLQTHGMRGSFDFISSTTKLTGKAKHLKAIRKTFSLRHEEMLYIGDELRDVKASQKAGIPVAAVSWGFNSRASLEAQSPDYLFDRPEDFLRLLAPR
jgi:phosphoglycolate phosphatase